MLTAKRAPKACLSCRSQLLALFEYGFTCPTIPIARSKLISESGKRSYSSSTNALARTTTRTFSTSPLRLGTDGDKNAKDMHAEEPPEEAAISNEENLFNKNLKVQRTEGAVEITNFEREFPGDMSDEAALDQMDADKIEKDFEFGMDFAEELVAAEKALRTEKATEMLAKSARERFGQYLPDGVLTANETAMYERLYGKPAKQTEEDEEIEVENGQNVLLRENAQGELEEVEYQPNDDVSDADADGPYVGEDFEYSKRKSKKRKDLEAKWQLKKDIAEGKSSTFGEGLREEYNEEEEVVDEEEVEEDEDGDYVPSDVVRTHPNTMVGRFGTTPTTVNLPIKTVVKPIMNLLNRTDIKHLVLASERAFGGKGIPHSASTPLTKILAVQKHIGLEAGQHKMSEIEADAYIACVLPATYATISSVLIETRKRLGRPWLHNLLNQPEGPRILDAGAAGAGILAWQEIVEAEWSSMKSDGLVKEDMDIPNGRQTVLTGSDTLRHRMSTMLENTTFLPRLPDYVHASNPETTLDGAGGALEARKKYDVIIAPHTLLPLHLEYRRRLQVENLWTLLNPEGGVLIIIEKGIPRGFEAVATARSKLLKDHIASSDSPVIENEVHEHEHKGQFTKKEKGMIVAPCTNHTKCPLYLIEGFTHGRKDYCHFKQRFIRPAFLQKIVGARSRNHEDVMFSYLVVQRGVDMRQNQPVLLDGRGQGSELQGEEATKAAFAGYESPFNVNEEGATLKVTNEEAEPPTPKESDAATAELSPFNLPRSLLPPIKRRGHVILDVCTPSGTLERWTVPKSFSRQAYRDARKSQWGDLWALGAKTRVKKEPRLGRKGLGEKGNGLGKRARGTKKGVNKFDVLIGEDGFQRIKERSDGRVRRPEKRTKGGRKPKNYGELKEDDF